MIITRIQRGERKGNASSHLRALHTELDKNCQPPRQDERHLSSATQVPQEELTQTRQATSSTSATFQNESQRTPQKFPLSLVTLSQDVSCSITPLQTESKENHETYTTTAAALNTAVEDLQRVSSTVVEELCSQAGPRLGAAGLAACCWRPQRLLEQSTLDGRRLASFPRTISLASTHRCRVIQRSVAAPGAQL